MGCMGNIAQDRAGLMGCLGAEAKAGKGRGLGDLEEEKVLEKKWVSVKSGLVSTLAWLCLASDQHSLSCLLIKFLSNSFPGKGLSILCARVCMGVCMPAAEVRGPLCPWCQPLEQVQVCECVMASEDQAGLASKQVK